MICQLATTTKLEKVAAQVLGCAVEEVRETRYKSFGLKVYSYAGLAYAVGTDEESDQAVREYIQDSVWIFNASFIASHTKGGATNGMIKAISALQEACEGCNEDIKRLINMDDFIEDAISECGRGSFLSGYDGNENETVIDGEMYFSYRLN
jgi:DNA-binding SARP family transcriptional activator